MERFQTSSKKRGNGHLWINRKSKRMVLASYTIGFSKHEKFIKEALRQGYSIILTPSHKRGINASYYSNQT